MLGVALDGEVLDLKPDEARVLLAALRELRVPHVVIKDPATPFADVVAALQVPPERVYFFAASPERADAARAAKLQGFDSLDDALEIVSAAYTRSALNLRYLFRTVLEWRPGHFKA